MTTYAYFWRNGRIDFGRSVPEGALTLAAHSNGRKLRQVVSIVARHAYDNETLLVPGIPEAASDDERLDAAVRLTREVAKRLDAS